MSKVTARDLAVLAEKWLRATYPDSHITRELSLGSWGVASVDVAAICDDQIVGVELKGDGDSPSRLKLQGAMYGRVCRTMFLLASPSLTERCQKHKPPEWQMIYHPEVLRSHSAQCPSSGIHFTAAYNSSAPRKGDGYGLAPMSMAEMVWSAERSYFLSRLTDGPVLVGKNKLGLANFIAENCSAVSVETALCATLRQRGWLGGKRVLKPQPQPAEQSA